MDTATAEHLHKYARGEMTSWEVRDATGLNYVEVLGGLYELGLRPYRASFDGINGPALKRGYDVLLAALTKGKG